MKQQLTETCDDYSSLWLDGWAVPLALFILLFGTVAFLHLLEWWDFRRTEKHLPVLPPAIGEGSEK